MIRHVIAGALALWGLMLAPAARAEWFEATSAHFILYAEGSEKSLRAQAVALERMDWGLRRFMTLPESPAATANRLTVFVTTDDGIRKLCQCQDAAGFYMPRVSGPVAFSARSMAMTDSVADSSRIVLFHEYAHHFLMGSYDIAFPAWYNEGFAEFASTMRITDEGVTIGGAANHRATGLYMGDKFSAREMLDPTLHARLRGGAAFDAFYGRGWLLTHYLSFNRDRFKQFQQYLSLINAGTPGPKAAEQAFGDLKALNREVDSYLTRNRIPGITMPLAAMPAPQVTVRALGAGEAALIRLRMESTRGVNSKTAPPLYRRAAALAARYPDDAIAQGWLAEMAYDAGEDAAAQEAVDRALARDPKSVQALLYKSNLALRAAIKAKATDPKIWAAARKPILLANRLNPDDAEPLWLFYLSFADEGAEPRASAYAGLYRAQQLVPQDAGVRFAAATERVKAGEADAAKQLLRPIAYNPHAGPDNAAARMLAALEAGKPKDEVLAAGEQKASAEVGTGTDTDKTTRPFTPAT